MLTLDPIVSSKRRFRKVTQTRPFQPNSSNSSKADHVPRDAPSESHFKKGVFKRKNKFGRVVLNLLKKSVPCISSCVSCAHEARLDGFLDVIDVPSRPVDKRRGISSPKVSADYNAEETHEFEERVSPLASFASASTQTTPERFSGKFFRKPKVIDSKLPFLQVASSMEQPFATHRDSFFEMSQLNSRPSITNIHRLSIYGCPTSTESAHHRAKHRVSETFLQSYPLNIYDGSVDTPTPKLKSTKTNPSIAPVDSIQTKVEPSLVRTSVKRERKKRLALRPVARRCYFKTRRTITSPRYTMCGVDIIHTRRKRFRRYKHLQTLSGIKEEDETTKDEYSTSESDSEFVPSLIGGDDSGVSPVFIEDLEFEEGVVGFRAVDAGVTKYMSHRSAVNGKDVMSTTKNTPVTNCRSSGLRPLLLPVRVALRDGH